MRITLQHGPQAARDRDIRVFRAIQGRLDEVEDEQTHHHAQAEHHYRLACWHVAQEDDRAQSGFELTTALARLERRLIRAAPSPKANGRAAA